jgi:hypothetical protein
MRFLSPLLLPLVAMAELARRPEIVVGRDVSPDGRAVVIGTNVATIPEPAPEPLQPPERDVAIVGAAYARRQRRAERRLREVAAGGWR